VCLYQVYCHSPFLTIHSPHQELASLLQVNTGTVRRPSLLQVNTGAVRRPSLLQVNTGAMSFPSLLTAVVV